MGVEQHNPDRQAKYQRGLAADEAADEALPAQSKQAAVSFHRNIERHVRSLPRVSCIYALALCVA